MSRFIVLLNFTEQGIRNVSQTIGRAEAFAKVVRQAGAAVAEQYWAMGPHDGVMILEAPDDQTAAALLAKLGTQGNVRTQSLRLFDRSEMESILAKVK